MSLDGHAWSELRTAADAAVAARAEAARGPSPWVSRRDVRVTEQGTTLRVEATWTVLAPTAGRFEAHLADGLDVASVDVDGRPWGASLGTVRAPIEDISVIVAGRAQIHLVGTVERQGGLDASFSLLPGVGTMHLPDALDLADVPRGAALFDGRWYASGAPFHVGPRRVGSYASEGVLMTARAAVGVTVGDAEIAVHARVSWALRRGRVSTVSLSAPGAGRDLIVTGAHVASITRVGDRIDVTLTEPAEASVTVELTWTSPIAAGESASIALPEVTPAGALSVERVLSVARDTDVEVVPRFERGEALPIESIPDWADGLITGTATATRRGDVAGRIDLLRFVPADRPAMVVDVAEWFVAAEGDGRTIAQGTLSVRNERASSLRIGLRPGMKLLAVQVEGRPVAAVSDPTGWRIPLPRSVETMRGLLSFPIELTVIGTDDVAWADGEDAIVALPVVDAEVAVRRVTLNLPRGTRALGADGDGGRVEAFSEGDGLAYGFAEGVDQARASALYQDALGAWMKNDFGEAQQRLDELKGIGGDNENVTRLQSNLDLVGGQVEPSGDEVLARRLKDQARARSLDEEQRQQDVLRYADEQLAAGNDQEAAEAYAAAAETADKLAQLEQSESESQRDRSREAKKKEAEAQSRNRRGGRTRSGSVDAVTGGLAGQGFGLSGSGEGGGGVGYVGWGDGFYEDGRANDPSGGEHGDTWAQAKPTLIVVEPGVPSASEDGWRALQSATSPPMTGAPADEEPVASATASLTPEEIEVSPPRDYREVVDSAAAVGRSEATSQVVITSQSTRRVPRGAPSQAARGTGAAAQVSQGGGTYKAHAAVAEFDFESDDVQGEIVMQSGSVASPASRGPAPFAEPKPVDAFEPLEVTATSAAVVVPAIGETVRFQQLLLPPGADVPVTIRVDLPRRFR